MLINELRIGNLLKQGQVCALDNEQAWAYKDGIVLPVYYKDCDPIPITEEWLLKFDFEKKIDFYSPDELWGKEEFENPRRAFGVFNPDNKDEWFVMFREDVGCGWSDLNEIKYVHQLQNLYFALTQEEL